MIIYERNKTKGFTGYRYTAKGYIDDKGNPITADTKEGTDMIEIECAMQSNKKESDVLDALKAEVMKKMNEYKPVYKA
jgi:hypothetical protein